MQLRRKGFCATGPAFPLPRSAVLVRARAASIAPATEPATRGCGFPEHDRVVQTDAVVVVAADAHRVFSAPGANRGGSCGVEDARRCRARHDVAVVVVAVPLSVQKFNAERSALTSAVAALQRRDHRPFATRSPFGATPVDAHVRVERAVHRVEPRSAREHAVSLHSRWPIRARPAIGRR